MEKQKKKKNEKKKKKKKKKQKKKKTGSIWWELCPLLSWMNLYRQAYSWSNNVLKTHISSLIYIADAYMWLIA